MRVRKSGMAEGGAIGLPEGAGFRRSGETEILSTKDRTFFWPVMTSICADLHDASEPEREDFQLRRSPTANRDLKRPSMFTKKMSATWTGNMHL
mmetsp:Transcript_81716/g.231626  ORF Transcript_81716/g.231626 Transcript_81716/m.231626 type:complete len:94 (+) Transcript_81716:1-282(+)